MKSSCGFFYLENFTPLTAVLVVVTLILSYAASWVVFMTVYYLLLRVIAVYSDPSVSALNPWARAFKPARISRSCRRGDEDPWVSP